MRISVLSGGVGGARFTRGLLAHLARTLPDGAGGTRADVTVVVNTGDDVWLHGVRVCPDLDTLMYTLGAAVNEEQGWGRSSETSRVSADLAAYGAGWEWFTLGDLDLATHLARTQWLREGATLTEVTQRLCRRWRPGARLLPMSDQEVETHVVVAAEPGPGTGTGTGTGLSPAVGRERLAPGERLIHFEEWWVRERAAAPALRFVQVGIASAVPAPGVLDAIGQADVVVIAPSNPVVSVDTILALPGVREAFTQTRAAVVGVSPIIGGAAVRGMAAQCLATIGVATSAEAVARHYGRRGEAGGVLDAWLVDTVDEAAAAALRAEGWHAVSAPAYMSDGVAAEHLAAQVMALAGR